MEELFSGIPSSGEWVSVTPISKGWSEDRKYLIQTRNGEKLLLRLSEEDTLQEKRKEYEFISIVSSLGFPSSRPIAFGQNERGEVYSLLSWVSGRDLEEVLPSLSEKEQYLKGREAGIILRKIHSIPLKKEHRVEDTKAKKLRQLSRYENSCVRLKGDENALAYVKNNIDEICRVAPVYQHGDFHPGNLIYMDGGRIGVIDFNRWRVGDPYEEFYKLQSFGREISIPYSVGEIDGYFDGRIPEEFWRGLAVYVAHASLYSIKWAEKFGKKDMDGMRRRAEIAKEDYDDYRRSIPKWYSKDMAEKYGKGMESHLIFQ